jgi:hypothetical protein
MRGDIPPLPNTSSWRGAQLKHRDNFTFTYRAIRSIHVVGGLPERKVGIDPIRG